MGWRHYDSAGNWVASGRWQLDHRLAAALIEWCVNVSGRWSYISSATIPPVAQGYTKAGYSAPLVNHNSGFGHTTCLPRNQERAKRPSAQESESRSNPITAGVFIGWGVLILCGIDVFSPFGHCRAPGPCQQPSSSASAASIRFLTIGWWQWDSNTGAGVTGGWQSETGHIYSDFGDVEDSPISQSVLCCLLATSLSLDRHHETFKYTWAASEWCKKNCPVAVNFNFFLKRQ